MPPDPPLRFAPVALMGEAVPLAMPLLKPPLFELTELESLHRSRGQSSLSWPPTLDYKPSTFKFIDSPDEVTTHDSIHASRKSE